jgi:hypothetical protein
MYIARKKLKLYTGIKKEEYPKYGEDLKER